MTDRELPTSPGSLIEWVETDEYGDSYSMVASAIPLKNVPDSEVIWAAATLSDPNDKGNVFSEEYIQEHDWSLVIETIPVDDAPFEVREAFEDGDTVLGAVYEAVLVEGDPIYFTTAPSFKYGDDFEDVFSVDAYGNTDNSEDRDAVFLPTQLI